MFYWPQPHDLRFVLSQDAADKGCEVIEAEILRVDRCWRGSVPGEYVPHTKTYHFPEIDQVARDLLLQSPDRVPIPEAQMLGNSHLSFTSHVEMFCLLREMADLGYVDRMPFAILPWDAAKFRFYFQPKPKPPLSDQPMLAFLKEDKYGQDHHSSGGCAGGSGSCGCASKPSRIHSTW